MLEAPLTPAMRELARLLEQRTGQRLSEGRHWRIETSLQPVLKSHGLVSLDALVSAIAVQPEGVLARAAVNALLNNETCFYRDTQLFRTVAHEIFPALMTGKGAGIIRSHKGRGARQDRTLRIWCAGVSTGQEAYSLAMLFSKYQDRWPDWRLHITATDISTDAIRQAQSGLFSQSEVQRGLPVNDLLRWFEPEGNQWRIHRNLRDMIDFRAENLFDDKIHAGPYSVVFCRNVLLYFSGERKSRLLHILSRHLGEGGHLLLGAGETLIGQRSEFVASPQFRGVYQRVNPALSAAGVASRG